MTERTGSTCYEIVIGGRPAERVLRPVIDDFAIELTGVGTTRVVGEVRDSSHLNGLLVHFTSLNVEVISLRRVDHATGTRPSTDTNDPTKARS